MKPEEKAEIILWNWLKTKAEFVDEVYFNRKNALNAPVFTTKGVNKKPDLIVKINRGWGTEYLCLEVKTGSDKNIHDSGKILMYYENYIQGLTTYYIDDEKIHLNHFGVASDNGINGCLFGSKNQWISNETTTLNKYNLLPTWESIRTSDFQRRLWAEWRALKIRLDIDRKGLPSIGILIGEKDSNLPHLFIMLWTNRNQWGQRWWKL